MPAPYVRHPGRTCRVPPAGPTPFVATRQTGRARVRLRGWSRSGAARRTAWQRRAWEEVLRPVAGELAAAGAGDVGRGDPGDRRASSRPAARPRVVRGQPREHRGEHSRLRADPRARRGSRRDQPRSSDARLHPGRCATRHSAHHLDTQLPTRTRCRLGRCHEPDRRPRRRRRAASDRDRALLSVAVRVRRRSVVSRRGFLQRRARALGAEHRRHTSGDDRHDPRRRADRRRAGQSTPRV